MTQTTASASQGQGFDFNTSAEFTIPTANPSTTADPHIVQTLLLCLHLRRRWEEILELLQQPELDGHRLLGLALSLGHHAGNAAPCIDHNLPPYRKPLGPTRNASEMRILIVTQIAQLGQWSDEAQQSVSSSDPKFGGLLADIRCTTIEATQRILRSPILNSAVSLLTATLNR
jgi:hypothetical protein